MDGELLSPHELVDELGDELFGVLVRSVDVIPSRDHHGEVERTAARESGKENPELRELETMHPVLVTRRDKSLLYFLLFL